MICTHSVEQQRNSIVFNWLNPILQSYYVMIWVFDEKTWASDEIHSLWIMDCSHRLNDENPWQLSFNSVQSNENLFPVKSKGFAFDWCTIITYCLSIREIELKRVEYVNLLSIIWWLKFNAKSIYSMIILFSLSVTKSSATLQHFNTFVSHAVCAATSFFKSSIDDRDRSYSHKVRILVCTLNRNEFGIFFYT